MIEMDIHKHFIQRNLLVCLIKSNGHRLHLISSVATWFARNV